MPRYLLSVYQPEGPPPRAAAMQAIMVNVDRVRRDMDAQGALVLTAGLEPPSRASVVRRKGDRHLVTDGPFAETKEFLGGFSIVRVPDLDAALAWARRLSDATTLPIEVRAIRESID